MRNRFTPASDMARISVSNSQGYLLIASVCLFSIICLGAAAIVIPTRWAETRAEWRPT